MSDTQDRRSKRRVAEERSQARLLEAEETMRAELGLLFRIHAVSHVITRRAQSRLAPHGLTLVSWRVLLTVALQPGLSAHEIVLLWGFEKMGVNRAVALLIDRELVRAGEDPDGGRRIPLLATPTGRQFIADAWPQARTVYSALSDALTARQLDVFNDYSDRLLVQARKITEDW